MQYFKRTPGYDELIKQYYPDDVGNVPEEIYVYKVVIISHRGKNSDGLFTNTYIDGEHAGIKLEAKDGRLISDRGISLRNEKGEITL